MPDEVETMFYYGETPWHKLGTKVEKSLTAEEAIIESGLDWEVDVVPVYTDYKGIMTIVEHKAAIQRKTDGRVLGVMSPQYKPVQNNEAFKFFDTVVGTGEAKYHTAGSLRDGQRIWMLAKLNHGKGSLSIKGDEVDKYLLLLNGHDGTLALKMFFTPVRVVCMNTLMAAQAGAKRVETFYAKHLGSIGSKMEQAKEILGLTEKFFEGFQEQALYLASHQLPPAELPKLLCAAFGTKGAIRPEDVVQIADFASDRQQVEMERVQTLFEGQGKGLNSPAIKGTKWAAYNAVVEHVDYQKKYRGENADNRRLEEVWFWNTAKKKAWDYLVA